MLQEALKLAEEGQKMQGIETDRFKLSAPKDGDWKSAADNAKSQLEYQLDRSINLELMSKFGSNQWKIANWQLEQASKEIQDEIEDIKEKIQSINRSRKDEQVFECLSHS
jgi:pre-mRNA-splicing factor SPF27